MHRPPEAGQPSRRGRPLRRLNGLLLVLHRAALRRPRVTLLAALVIVAVLATQIPRIPVLLAIDDLVDPSLPSTERSRTMKADFRLGHSILLVFQPEGADGRHEAASLERIAAWVRRQRDANVELLRVVSPFDLERRRIVGGQRWTTPLLADADPERLAALGRSPWASILTDGAGRDVAVELAFRDTIDRTRFGSFDPSAVERLLQDCAGELDLDEGDITVHVTGAAAFEYFALQGIRRFRVLNVALLAGVLLIFRLLFGTWRSGFLLCGVIGFAGLVVYGSMGLAGAPIDYLSTGLFLMLSVAALEDYLFLSYQQLSRGHSPGRSFRSLLTPSLFTSLTTMVGFGALFISDLELIQRFGLWAAWGALIEWVTTFLVLPALLRLGGTRASWVDRSRAWRPRLPAFVAGLSMPARVALVLLVVHPLALVAVLNLNTSDALTRLFPAGHPHREGLEYLARTRGWSAELSVVFPGPPHRETVGSVLAELASHPNVARVTDPYEVVRFMTGGLTAPGAFPTLFHEDGRSRSSLYLRRIELDGLNDTLQAVERACREGRCHAAGDLASYAEFSSRVPSALLRSLALCLLLVGLIVVFLVRSTGRGSVPRVLAAALWGPSFMLTLLWAFQIPVNFLTCVFASVLVGLTGDNAIQYLFAGRGRIGPGIEQRGGASIQVALVMGLACLLFLGSTFVPSRRLGLLLGVGFVASLCGDLWILRSLTASRRRG